MSSAAKDPISLGIAPVNLLLDTDSSSSREVGVVSNMRPTFPPSELSFKYRICNAVVGEKSGTVPVNSFH